MGQIGWATEQEKTYRARLSGAATAGHPGLGGWGLNNRHAFLTPLEAGGPRSRPTDWNLGRTLFGTCRRPPSPSILTGPLWEEGEI